MILKLHQTSKCHRIIDCYNFPLLSNNIKLRKANNIASPLYYVLRHLEKDVVIYLKFVNIAIHSNQYRTG